MLRKKHKLSSMSSETRLRKGSALFVMHVTYSPMAMTKATSILPRRYCAGREREPALRTLAPGTGNAHCTWRSYQSARCGAENKDRRLCPPSHEAMCAGRSVRPLTVLGHKGENVPEKLRTLSNSMFPAFLVT